MRQPLSDSDEFGKPKFKKIMDEFLLQPGLPFATVVTAEKSNRVFAHNFGELVRIRFPKAAFRAAANALPGSGLGEAQHSD